MATEGETQPLTSPRDMEVEEGEEGGDEPGEKGHLA